jgi:hypothetical protein
MASFLKSRKVKVVIIAAIAMVVLFAAFIIYIDLLISSAAQPSSGAPHPTPRLGAYLSDEALVSYNNAMYMYPLAVVTYTAANSPRLYVNATIYQSRPPGRVYLLNYTNFCYLCGNTVQVANSLQAALNFYNLTPLYGNLSVLSLNHLDQLQNDSILVVLNGLMPSQFFDAHGNTTELEYILSKHTSIIYVGQNFTDMLVQASSPLPLQNPSMPSFLQTYYPKQETLKHSPFYFNTTGTFDFVNGSYYGPVTYKNVSGGSIVAFSNTLAAWPSPQKACMDIAKAISQTFWLPKYAAGSIAVQLNGSSDSGNAGDVLDSMQINYTKTLPAQLNSGYLRIAMAANSLYNNTYHAYRYIDTVPALSSNGTVRMSPSILPDQYGVKIEFNITLRPKQPVNLSAYMQVDNQNLRYIESLPEFSLHNFSKSSLNPVLRENLSLGPGSYIIQLRNFTDKSVLASGLFNVSPINITYVKSASNTTTGVFVFHVYSQTTLLSNINYSVSLNNFPASNGIIQAGTITYQLPAGTPPVQPSPSGITFYNFTFAMLSQKFYFHGDILPSTPFTISAEYIELGIVVLMMLIMVAFVRGPQRDEFYIDVPNLPEEPKTSIKLKAGELMSVFDKLNENYHWKYMPLSKPEVKYAIALNLRYNNIPVELTYHNVDSILDSLLVNEKIVSADELYAPASWIGSSKHDIEYLATFKKLRIYFVTHSYIFTDIDVSAEADMVASLRKDKKYMIIYSKTSRFKNIPVPPDTRMYLVFLNSYALDEFKEKLYNSYSKTNERLKMYISSDCIRLVDADNIAKDIA